MNPQSFTESTHAIENPSVPAGMRKCLRVSCRNCFETRGPKVYCSRRCQRAEHERRARQNLTPARRASQYRRTLRYRESHPESLRTWSQQSAIRQTESRRRMSASEFEQRIKAQGNRCPIGNHEFGTERGRGLNNPSQDHCHETGQNRAVLCNRHNMALGLFDDSPERMQEAASYVLAWREMQSNKS